MGWSSFSSIAMLPSCPLAALDEEEEGGEAEEDEETDEKDGSTEYRSIVQVFGSCCCKPCSQNLSSCLFCVARAIGAKKQRRHADCFLVAYQAASVLT